MLNGAPIFSAIIWVVVASNVPGTGGPCRLPTRSCMPQRRSGSSATSSVTVIYLKQGRGGLGQTARECPGCRLQVIDERSPLRLQRIEGFDLQAGLR